MDETVCISVMDNVILGVLVWELEYVEDTVSSGVIVRIVEGLGEVDGVLVNDDAVVGDGLDVV
jgi:hypothetical protein